MWAKIDTVPICSRTLTNARIFSLVERFFHIFSWVAFNVNYTRIFSIVSPYFLKTKIYHIYKCCPGRPNISSVIDNASARCYSPVVPRLYNRGVKSSSQQTGWMVELVVRKRTLLQGYNAEITMTCIRPIRAHESNMKATSTMTISHL